MFRRLVTLTLVLSTVFLVACGAEEIGFGARDTVAEEPALDRGADAFEAEASEVEADVDDVVVSGDSRTTVNRNGARLIIKDGNLTVEAADTEAAVAAGIDIIVGFDGYIIDQRVFEQQNGRFASVRFGVPVEHFERAMSALRTLGDVQSESATGEDVTDEFVDLNARLENLEATRARLRTFLDEAETVEEALAVNAELTKIEEEINLVQGRINFLADRAAFSTITLEIRPVLPEPTPTPLPTPQSWQPGDTVQRSLVTLQETAQDAADLGIQFSIVCLPWILLIGLPLLLILTVFRRRRRRKRTNAGAAGNGGRGRSAEAAPAPAPETTDAAPPAEQEDALPEG